MCTRIVLGIKNKETYQKLLEMDLENTVQFCQFIKFSEKSRQEINELQHNKTNSKEVKQLISNDFNLN